MSKRICIHKDSKPAYDIVIEDSFSKLADEISNLQIKGRKICVVTDSNVEKYYLEEIISLISSDNTPYSFVFEAGEQNKNLDVVRDLYEYLIIKKFDRKDVLLALGGGVVGDLTGYAAATYLRGINFIQVPTTLLAQVDSSIGGKTGVDFSSYKNMVGAFHMPQLVYINTGSLKSLDTRIFNSGFGEIIKHGYIMNSEYLDFLSDNFEGIRQQNPALLEQMIYESCMIKGSVVERDPTEQGDRALLNFGHTLGHAVEKLSGFSLYHGECVVLGMICAISISIKKGKLSEDVLNSAIDLFKKYDYPLKIQGISPEAIIETSRNDKKMDQGQIKFILLDSVGHAFIDSTVTEEEMAEAIKLIV